MPIAFATAPVRAPPEVPGADSADSSDWDRLMPADHAALPSRARQNTGLETGNPHCVRTALQQPGTLGQALAA